MLKSSRIAVSRRVGQRRTDYFPLGGPVSRVVPNPRIPVWDVGEIRLAVRVRDPRRGADVANAAHRELVSASGQTPVASPSSAATYISVLQSARRWCRSGGNFLLGLAAEAEKSEKKKKRITRTRTHAC